MLRYSVGPDHRCKGLENIRNVLYKSFEPSADPKLTDSCIYCDRAITGPTDNLQGDEHEGVCFLLNWQHERIHKYK